MSTPEPNNTYVVEYQQFLKKSLVQAQVQAQVKAQQLQKKQWSQPMSNVNYTTTTGRMQAYEKEYEVSRIVKRAKGGYFFVISVDVTDNVFYRVWKGGILPYMVAKTFKYFGSDIDGNKTTWNNVTKRTHLPATLGSAYDMIEAAIKGDTADQEHDAYITELLKTKPDSLKMIGSLEKLAEGDVDEPDEPVGQNTGSSTNVGGAYSNNVAVAPGAGNVVSFNAAQGQSITFDTAAEPGDVVAGGIEAEKITLNGQDLEEKLQEAADEIQEKFEALSQRVEAGTAP